MCRAGLCQYHFKLVRLGFGHRDRLQADVLGSDVTMMEPADDHSHLLVKTETHDAQCNASLTPSKAPRNVYGERPKAAMVADSSTTRHGHRSPLNHGGCKRRFIQALYLIGAVTLGATAWEFVRERSIHAGKKLFDLNYGPVEEPVRLLPQTGSLRLQERPLAAASSSDVDTHAQAAELPLHGHETLIADNEEGAAAAQDDDHRCGGAVSCEPPGVGQESERLSPLASASEDELDGQVPAQAHDVNLKQAAENVTPSTATRGTVHRAVKPQPKAVLAAPHRGVEGPSKTTAASASGKWHDAQQPTANGNAIAREAAGRNKTPGRQPHLPQPVGAVTGDTTAADREPLPARSSAVADGLTPR